MVAYVIQFVPSADKALRRLPTKAQRRIVTAVDSLAENPRPAGCTKLAGEENLWRIRVGDYRVVYSISDKDLIVLVLRVAHRKDVYRHL
jgi:mRNA interferase RelE/StbE